MEICKVCWCCSSICECGDEALLEEAVYCENCGSLCAEDDVNGDGFCEETDCETAYEEYRDEMVGVIITNLDNPMRNL